MPPNMPPVAPEVGAADDVGAAELAPAPPNSPVDELVAGAAALLDAVVAGPGAGVELVGVLTSGFLNKFSPAVEPAEDGARNRADVGVAEGVAALSLSPPPRLNPPKDGADAGCEAAGCDAGVDPPRLNVGGLLAGVLDRPAPPNRPPAGLGVSCELGVAAGAAPPKSPAEAGGVALLFASFEPPAPPKRPVGAEAPAGLAPNKLDGVPGAGAAAGFDMALPNKPPPDGAPLD